MKWPPIYRGQKLLKRFVGDKSQKSKSQKNSCWVCQNFWQTTGRPGRSTANGQKSDRWGSPVDRVGRLAISREQQVGAGRVSVDLRSTDTHMHICACRSSAGRLPVDRSLWISEKSEFTDLDNFGFWFWVLDKMFWSWKIIEYEHVSYYYQGKILGKNSFDKNLIFNEMFFPKTSLSKIVFPK